MTSQIWQFIFYFIYKTEWGKELQKNSGLQFTNSMAGSKLMRILPNYIWTPLYKVIVKRAIHDYSTGLA